MRLGKFSLLLAILVCLLLGNLMLAGAQPLWAEYVQGPKLTITNHSGYPDNQVYLVFWALPYAETDGNNFHRLKWDTRTFPLMDYNNDNQTTIGDQKYADYSITLDKLALDSEGHRYFFLPKAENDQILPDKTGFKAGRLWISFKTPVYTYVSWNETDPNYHHLDHTQPSYSNATDPNYNTVFDFFEPAIDPIGGNYQGAIWGDTTQVDALAIPLLYELKDGGQSLGKKGHSRPLRAIRSFYMLAPAPFNKLVTPTYVLAPGHGMERTPSLIKADYYANYVAYCWGYWDASTTDKTLTLYYCKDSDKTTIIKWTGSLAVNPKTAKSAIKFTGTYNSASEDHYIDKPTSKDVFLCNGAFDAGAAPSPEPVGWTGRDKDLKNQVASALNRTVFHLAPYPDGDHTSIKFPWQKYGPPSGYSDPVSKVHYQFYQQNGLSSENFATNVYSKIDHQLSYDGCCYGFAYDDNGDSSSTISGPKTANIFLTIGNCTGLPLPYLDLLLN